MTDPAKIQSFIKSKFKEIEIVATKRDYIRRIIGILSSLSPDEIDTIIDFRNFERYQKMTAIEREREREPEREREREQGQGQGPIGFHKASKFMGYKPGYVFYNGQYGLGYYIDNKLLPSFTHLDI